MKRVVLLVAQLFSLFWIFLPLSFGENATFPPLYCTTLYSTSYFFAPRPPPGNETYLWHRVSPYFTESTARKKKKPPSPPRFFSLLFPFLSPLRSAPPPFPSSFSKICDTPLPTILLLFEATLSFPFAYRRTVRKSLHIRHAARKKGEGGSKEGADSRRRRTEWRVAYFRRRSPRGVKNL